MTKKIAANATLIYKNQLATVKLPGPAIGLGASFSAGVGLVCVFCGVTNAPMTSILLSYELFGGKGVELMALAIAVSYMTSGYHSLFHSQKIAYSKIKAKYVDVFSDDNLDE